MQKVIDQLVTTHDPDERTRLLKEFRLLISQADEMIKTEFFVDEDTTPA